MKYSMPKSLRDKKRYISFHVECDSPLEEENVKKAIIYSSLSLMGEMGTAISHLWFISWDKESGNGIIRCSPLSVDLMIVSLKCISDIQKCKVNTVVLGVSGTLKSLSTSSIMSLFT